MTYLATRPISRSEFEFDGPDYVPTRILFGLGCAETFGEELENLAGQSGARKILLVTGRASPDKPWQDVFHKEVAAFDHLTIESRVSNPTFASISEILAKARRARVDLVVGGGSVLDAAKCVAVLARGDQSLRRAILRKDLPEAALPILAVPTTSGTGSEVTSSASVWDDVEKTKYTLADPRLYPKVAIIDPALSATMPAAVIAGTDLDALSHALESCWSVNASDGSIEYGIRAKDGVERKMQPFLIDNYKLSHWFNARKLTLPMAAERADLDPALVAELVKGRRAELPLDEAGRLAQVLNVSVGHLAGGADRLPDVIHHTREQVEATRRAVNRGGIHFYNYYTLPSPNGYISPVLIDILCPSDRLPIQNNGHLEPAITINLGPGHINGLWGHELNDDTWHPFYANDTAKESWILGDSYLEPPYCPHTYARHGDEPTQILSYTIRSNLEPFLAASNGWSDQAYDNFLAGLADRPFGATVLRTFMKRHAYHTASLAARAGIGDNRLAVFLDGDEDALEVAEMQDLGRLLGFDYRMLLPVVRNHDAVGKSWCSIKQSIRSIRAYESYTVASMSASAQCANLMGLFIKVSNPGPLGEPDLMDHSSCHFLVTGGVMTFVWQDANGERREQVLGDRDALWVGSFVRHGFYGAGSLIKMGNGEGSSYLDYFEMSNTYEAAQALRRGRKDTTSRTPVSG